MFVVTVPPLWRRKGLHRSSPSRKTFWKASAVSPEVPPPAFVGPNQEKWVAPEMETIIFGVVPGIWP